MTRRWAVVCLASVTVAAPACKEKHSERVAASYSSVTRPTDRPPPAHEPPKLLVGIDAVPAEEDYEVRAASAITEANVQAKLTELERELSLSPL